MTAFLLRLFPEPTPVGVRERLRSAFGALLGILVTGLVARAALGADAGLPALIAPMGASAVLLFAVPASPLAQPWSILGGNLVAAVVGVTAAELVPHPAYAAAIAVGVAVVLMMTARCLHPPSGAVALTAVLGGPAIRDLGYGYVLWPVAANSVALLAVALAFNALCGRSYPHLRPSMPAGRAAVDPPPSPAIGFEAADLDAALADFDQLLEVDREDLAAILRRVQLRTQARRLAPTTCAAIMSRDVHGIAPCDTLAEALHVIRHSRVKALPVTDEGARVLGLVTEADLVDKAVWGRRGPRLGLARRLRLTVERGRAPGGRVADVMSVVEPVHPETPLGALALRMTRPGVHHLPVVGGDGRLVGIVAQTDLLAALVVEPAGRRRDATASATPA